MLDDLLYYLSEPFIVLSGTPVSALSILTGLVIFLVIRIASGILARSLGKLIAARGAGDGVGFAVTKITRWIGTIIGVFIALTTVGVNMNAALAAMAVLLVGIGFGLQKMAENFISGLILLVERPIKIGDFVGLEDRRGTIADIGLRATRVVSRDGFEIIIPNGELISKQVVNYMSPTPTIRLWIAVGVAYGTDLALAREALLEVAAADEAVLEEPAPMVLLGDFGDSSIELSLAAWIERPTEDLIIKSRLRFAIVDAFARRAITIPFPQRDLHLRSLPGIASAAGQKGNVS